MVVQQAFAGDAARRVNVFVLSPSTQSERQFSTSASVADIKSKLESVTGIPAGAQQLVLHAPSLSSSSYELDAGQPLAALTDDSRTLGEYAVQSDGYIIRVSSADDAATRTLRTFVEDANVQKFNLTDAEYAQRTDTVMAYKARNKIGRFANTVEHETSIPEGLVIGARVKVDMSASGTFVRLGTVRYVGETSFAKGTWVGVEYDEPVGKNDGSVDGQRYFQNRPKYGGFVKPEKCQPGQFPVEDDDLDLDSD